MRTNNLITGIPRSGTSLVSSLVAKNPDTLVFSEPSWLKEIRELTSDSSQFSNQLVKDITQIRNSILNGKPVGIKLNKSETGIPSNYFQRSPDGEIIHNKTDTETIFPINTAHKNIFIKANAQFTACLNSLIATKQFKIVCIVRNPVSAIMSWRSLQIPVSFGNMKIAEKYSPDFSEFINDAANLLDKQIMIADWFFKQYSIYLNHVTLIKYEDLILNAQNELSKFLPDTSLQLPKLKSANHNPHYNLDEADFVKERMIKLGHYYKHFYPAL